MNERGPGSAVEALVSRYLDTLVADYPTTATFLGFHERDGELGEHSADAQETQCRHLRDLLRDLDEVPLDGADVDTIIDARSLRSALRRGIYSHDVLKTWKKDPSPYIRTVLGGCNSLILKEFAPMEERAEALLSRLRAAPRVLESALENVASPPGIYAIVGRESALGGISFIDSVLPKVAAQVPAVAADIARAGAELRAAFANVADVLGARADDGASDFYVGRESFDWLLREEHLLDLDSDSLREMGLAAIEATRGRMKDVARTIDATKDWHEVVEEIKADHPSADQLRDRYQSEMIRARDFVVEKGLVGVPESESLEVIDTPEYARPTLPYAAYMPPGPFEAQQKGLFYVTPVDASRSPEAQERQLRGHSNHTIPVVALHEGYPGHHLQLVRANAAPSLIRKISWSTVWGEGWALYCEEMMWETGFFTDPRTRLGQLKEVLWRAARIVVDVGLQLGEMSVDEAVEFMMSEVGLERVNATAEVKRYTSHPTQPSSYMIGKHEILKIRADFERSVGGSFSLRTFHDRLLDLGNLQPSLARVGLGLDDAASI